MMQTSSQDSERQAYHDSFAAKLRRFMVDNAASFNALTTKEQIDPSLDDGRMDNNDFFCGDPLPLEYVMQVPLAKRKKEFLRFISPGDVVQGHVTLKTPLALGVQITFLVSTRKVREISQLGIQGLVHHEDLASGKTKCDQIFEEMEIDDVVRAVIIEVKESDLKLSFSSENMASSSLHSKGIHLGFIEGKRIASIKKRPKSLSLFLDELEDDPGFTNPSSSENLKHFLGVPGYDSETKPTLIEAIQQKAHFHESDFSYALRKVQRHNWSMDTVAVGVRHFKNGELEQAMKLFNHALDIDPCNVEGLVARGALLANKCKFTKAIAEFESALTINHTHKNARRYLVDTQIAYGKKLEEDGHLEGAVVSYREALADDPSQTAIRTRLDALVSRLQKKAAEKLEMQRREAAERKRMKKLRSIIKDERKKKERKKKTKKSSIRRVSGGHSKKSQKKKYSKHRYSSSEDDSSSTYSSSFSSSSSPPPSKDSSLHRRQLHKTRSTSSRSPPTRDSAAGGKYSRSRSSSSHESTRKSHSRKRGRYSRSRSSSSTRSRVRSRSRSYTPPRSEGRRKHSKSKLSVPRSREHSTSPRLRGEREYSISPRSRGERGPSKHRNPRSYSHTPEG